MRVVAGFAGQAREVHGKKCRVGEEECQPEVPLAEALGEDAAVREQREPVVSGAEEAEDSGHGHDEVEVGDDEEGVVQILVEDGLGEDGAGEAAGDEERDEAEREEHRRGERRPRAPGGREPAEDLGGGGHGDGHRGGGEGGPGEGIETGDEHVVSPDDDAEQADGERGRDHQAVGEDAAAAEVRDDHEVRPMPGRMAM